MSAQADPEDGEILGLTNGPARPTVSVIIPTYGREEALRHTLSQLLDQELSPDEILVVDQTLEHLPETERFLGELAESGRIRWIRLDTRGAARARNTGILEARGDVLLLLDDDLLFPRGFVAAHLRNYRDPQTIGIIGAFSGEGERQYEPVYELPPEAFREPFGWMHRPGNLALRCEKALIHTGNLSVRRLAALAVGGFDENFGPLDLHADFDFGWRLKQLNLGKTYHDPGAAVFHLKAPRGGCRREESRWHLPDVNQIYPMFYFYLKNFALWPSLPHLLKPIRTWVLNRGNLARPWYLAVALGRYLRALGRGFRLAAGPPQDLTRTNPAAVEAARHALRETAPATPVGF